MKEFIDSCRPTSGDVDVSSVTQFPLSDALMHFFFFSSALKSLEAHCANQELIYEPPGTSGA